MGNLHPVWTWNRTGKQREMLKSQSVDVGAGGQVRESEGLEKEQSYPLIFFLNFPEQ